MTTPVEPSLFAMDKFKIYEDVQAEKQVTKKKQKILSIDPIIKPDDFEIKKQIELLTEAKITNKITDIDDIKIIDKPIDEDEIFNMIDVEKVPIYPGCESAKTNDKRKKCMSEKITQLIQKKFNTDIASELGLVGIQKINVQFKIDKKGNITDIKTRAPFSQLEDEALRVVEKIPVMKPGLQRGQPVSVLYNLPIVFKVQ